MTTRLAFLLILSIASCQALSAKDSGAVQQYLADKTVATAEQWTHHDDGEVSLSIVVPKGWETYNTSAGIVLNEYMGSGAPGVPLRGFLIHIFVPYVKRLRMPEPDQQVNYAWYVLKQVVHDPDYVGDALVSEPVAFQWDQYDAAYYLLNNRDQTVTMLLALEIPDHTHMVVCHISVPEDQATRIRRLLPDLLSTLTIDDHLVGDDALHNLPDPLVFPVVDQPDQ